MSWLHDQSLFFIYYTLYIYIYFICTINDYSFFSCKQQGMRLREEAIKRGVRSDVTVTDAVIASAFIYNPLG